MLKSPCFVYEAKRKFGMFCMSCRSTMNFVRESLFAGPIKNSGSVWRSAFATTNSDGGMSRRMVRSQDPKELQTSLGAATARYWRDALGAFRAEITERWRRTLIRRSQKGRLTWARMAKLADDWLPKPRILHPWPNQRFAF